MRVIGFFILYITPMVSYCVARTNSLAVCIAVTGFMTVVVYCCFSFANEKIKYMPTKDSKVMWL